MVRQHPDWDTSFPGADFFFVAIFLIVIPNLDFKLYPWSPQPIAREGNTWHYVNNMQHDTTSSSWHNAVDEQANWWQLSWKGIFTVLYIIINAIQFRFIIFGNYVITHANILTQCVFVSLVLIHASKTKVILT